MGSFENGIAENMVEAAAERHITSNFNLDWDKVETHEEIERIAQEIEVASYCSQRRIAEALHSIASLDHEHDKLKTVLAKYEGKAFEERSARLTGMEKRSAMAKDELRDYLKSIFGSEINPLTALQYIRQAKKNLLRHAADIAAEIPGYEVVKAEDVGRTIDSPEKGRGTIVHVDPERAMISWESGEEQWMTQEELQMSGVKLGDESGTAVQAENDGGTQGPSDSPDGTIGTADRERNPLMDYLQGFELDEEEQEGPKKAPSQGPRPSKMTMSAGSQTTCDGCEKPLDRDKAIKVARGQGTYDYFCSESCQKKFGDRGETYLDIDANKKKAAYGDYDVDPDSAEGLAESFINGNISDVRRKVGRSMRKFNAVLQVLQEVAPDSAASFQRIMANASLKVSAGYAVIRRDVATEGELPPTDAGHMTDDMLSQVFISEQPDEKDNEEFNTKLTTMEGDELWVNSIDFEFFESEDEAKAYASRTASVDYPTDKPGANKSNPQEPETINPTPKNIKYRLEALDEATKTWKEIGVYKSMEEANEKATKLKEELPMTMETKTTPLVGLDEEGRPDYKTTPEGGPKTDNDKQEVKEVKASDDVNEGKEGARWCTMCDQWVPADALLAKNGCPTCWSPTMSKEEKLQTESSLTKKAVAPEGWEGTVKKLKKHKDKVDNPWALAWWMKGQNYKPGGKKSSSLQYRDGSWELWIEGDTESPHIFKDPAVIAHVAAKKLDWPLRRATAVMRYTKDLNVPYTIYAKTIDK